MRKIVNVDEAETRGITQGEALVFLTQKGAAPGGVELVCQIAPPVHLKEGDLSLVRGQIIAYYKPAQIVLQCESAERR